MIEIEIDGQALQVEEGSMVIQAADNAGIYIPRFCYHKKLTVAANCRMCLVEVEKSPKTLPACATPVMPGMKVFTRSAKALAAQRAVMEFLLINHPLDCPICDQGGECELQDLSMGYGKGLSRFTEGKRSVKDKNLGALVASEMTRCIQCTRCVRFGSEIAGMRELGATERGDRMEIGTYVEHTLQSEISGNIIDLCPVGALTSKPYRFTGRSWEMRQHAAVAPHDCIGSNIFIHTRGEEFSPKRHVMRVVPKDNEAINETWISDRDRYSYTAVNSEQRLTMPLLKIEGQWQEVDWETALSAAVEQLNHIIAEKGADQIGALISHSATTEEFYLLQKLMRSLGSSNIDHRYRQNDFRDQDTMPAFPALNIPIEELEKQNAVLLIGSNIRQEQPVANIRLRKISVRQGHVMCVNPIDYHFNYVLSEEILDPDLVLTLSKIVKALNISSLPESLRDFVNQVEVDTVAQAIANNLKNTENSLLLLGAYALNHPQASFIRLLAQQIAEHSQSRLGSLTEGANTAGAWLAGAIPHRGPAGAKVFHEGRDAQAMLKEPRQAYLLYDVEVGADTAYSALALKAMEQASTVISFTSYANGLVKDYATIILPIAAFPETSGTFINAQGQWQSFTAATLPYAEAKPGWKILRVLGNLLHLADFEYVSSEEILAELKTQTDVMDEEKFKQTWQPRQTFKKEHSVGFLRFSQWHPYCIDNTVRHSSALQATIKKDEVIVARVSPQLASQLNLQAGESVKIKQQDSWIILPLVIDESMIGNLVSIPAGVDQTAGFGEVFGEITIEKN